MTTSPDQSVWDQWRPTTSRVGFINADLTTTATTMVQWGESLHPGTNRAQHLEGPRAANIERLEPLSMPGEERAPFCATSNLEWTAYFSYNRQGADPAPVSVLARRIGVNTDWAAYRVPAPASGMFPTATAAPRCTCMRPKTPTGSTGSARLVSDKTAQDGNSMLQRGQRRPLIPFDTAPSSGSTAAGTKSRSKDHG